MDSSDFELPLPDFLAAVASRTPAPGGGSVAALSGALSAALVEMAARFSDEWERASEVADDAAALRERLTRLAVDDAEAFAAYLAAEPDARVGALARAIEVPEQVGQAVAEVVTLAEEVARGGNPNLRGDAFVAVHVAQAARQAAHVLVDINRAEGD